MRVVLIETDQNMIDKIKSVTSKLLVFKSWKLAREIIQYKDYDLLVVNYKLMQQSNINLLEKIFELDIQKELVTVFDTPKNHKKCYKRSIYKNMNADKINNLLNLFAPKNEYNNIITSLNELGISSRLRGYLYLKDAILMVIKKKKVNLTTDLYPVIAKEYKTTTYAVERAIRNAIEVGWTRGNIKLIESLFNNKLNYDQDRPSNREYIFCLADYLKNHL